MRIDMQNSITTCKPAAPNDAFRRATAHTLGGAMVKEDNNVAFCKMVETELGTTYYIKYNRDHQPYNPVTGLNTREHLENHVDGEPKLRFQLVTAEDYKNYMRFLVTKNTVWITYIGRNRF